MLPAQPQFYDLSGVEGIRAGFISWIRATAAKMGLVLPPVSGSAADVATAFVNALKSVSAAEKAQQELIINAELERIQQAYDAQRAEREAQAIAAAALSNEAYREYMTQVRERAFNPAGAADVYTFYTPAISIPYGMAGLRDDSPMQQILSGLAADNVKVTPINEQSPVDFLKDEMAKDRCIPTPILTAAFIALILSR